MVPGAAAGEECRSELNGAVLERQVRTADGVWLQIYCKYGHSYKMSIYKFILARKQGNQKGLTYGPD